MRRDSIEVIKNDNLFDDNYDDDFFGGGNDKKKEVNKSLDKMSLGLKKNVDKSIDKS